MTAVFVVCFVLGLLLAVHVMLYGVERAAPPMARAPHEPGGGGHDPRTEPRPLLNGQNVGAFVTTFGLAGHVLQRTTSLGPLSVVALALLVGALGAALSVALLAAWAIPGARGDVVDERYLLQGHPASVTRAIADHGDGEIAYEADGRRWSVVARSWDGTPLVAGTEVVIERVEDGVAYVEQWAEVEARL